MQRQTTFGNKSILEIIQKERKDNDESESYGRYRNVKHENTILNFGKAQNEG